MVRHLLIAIAAMAVVTTAGLADAAGPSDLGRQGSKMVRKQTSAAKRATDVAAADLARLRGERKTWVNAKRSLAARYKKQLANIDKLKRRRSGWRRNRELRAAYAETQATARRLAKFDRRVRSYEGRLVTARQRLLAAVTAELATKPSSRRARYLRAMRRSASRGASGRRRRIVLPNDRIDPLASAEELEEQAELLRKSEKQLAREIENLEARERRLSRMAKLKRTRARASEMGTLDVNNPRRTIGRTGTSGSANNRGSSGGGVEADQAEPSPAPGEAGSPPTDGSDDFQTVPGGGDSESSQADYAVILADVVDTPTIEAYRSADRSGDPRRRASATRRLRIKAQQRLRRLRAKRQQMIKAAKRRKR
ncbi:MAG: hypothetical protein KJO07_00515 [Deltaproteobacteria bacterium]|jgi:hypothetical protein|nr:hypothetical protein [Deltaproteobacteria bacterium]